MTRTSRLLNATDVASGDVLAIAGERLLVGSTPINDGEVIILQIRSSLWFILLSSATSLAVIGFATFFLAYLPAVQPTLYWDDSHAFTFGVAAIVTRLGWQWLEWYGRVYVLTNRRIVSRAGVLRPTVYERDLRSIRHTTVYHRLRERLLGLGTLGFSVGERAAVEAAWATISHPLDVQQAVDNAIRRARHGC